MDARFFGPFHYGLRLALEGQLMIAATIPILLLHGRPPAILRAIATIIVDAINGHLRWAFAHIGQEVAEIQPALADRNAPAAPVGKLYGFGIRTSLDHVCPTHVGRTLASIPRIMAVFRLGFTDTFSHVAPA